MDSFTLMATFGQTEPRTWLSLVAAYALAVSLAVLLSRWRMRWQLLACVLLVAATMPLSQHAEQRLGVKDDRRILADEAMTFPVATLGLPLWRHPWLLPGALVTSWVLDNQKPPPVAQAQSLPGGAGIVMDDVLSNLYTLGLAHLALWLYRRRRRGRTGEGG